MLSLLTRNILASLLIVAFVHADEWTNPPAGVDDLDTQWTVGLHVKLTWNLSRIVNPITIRLRHWRARDVAVATLLEFGSNPKFHGSFNWVIGDNDDVDANSIAVDKTFVLDLVDPSGNISDGNGWVNKALSSKGFIINSKPTNSSSSSVSTSASKASTPATATGSAGLGASAKVSLGVGLGLGVPLLVIVVVLSTRCVIFYAKGRKAGDGITTLAGFEGTQSTFLSNEKHRQTPLTEQNLSSGYFSQPRELDGQSPLRELPADR